MTDTSRKNGGLAEGPGGELCKVWEITVPLSLFLSYKLGWYPQPASQG